MTKNQPVITIVLHNSFDILTITPPVLKRWADNESVDSLKEIIGEHVTNLGVWTDFCSSV